MENAIFGAVGGAVCALLCVLLVVLLRRRSRQRSDLAALLEAAQREVDDLRLRLDIANARLEGHTGARRNGAAADRTAEYVITEVGSQPGAQSPGPALLFAAQDLPDQAATSTQVEVPDRLVLTATLGAPLVKVAAFSHGIGRALSAESRNRIRFEMRREVRASRKRRRRAVKQYLRDVRADDRSREGI